MTLLKKSWILANFWRKESADLYNAGPDFTTVDFGMTDVTELAILTATTELWQLVAEDKDLLVVVKPAKLLTVPGRHPANRDCLVSRVQAEFPTAQVVHRLDYDTSGLVLLPLNKRALSDLSKQFQARTVKKHYQALVSGEIALHGEVDLPIAPDPEHRPLYKICPTSGKASRTLFQRLCYDPVLNVSRVLLEPVTGRSHQLRLHLASLGHPILGDEFYAPEAVRTLSSRLCLHACRIQFRQPGTMQWREFEVAAEF